jgi:hypothetical protein
MRFKRGYGNSRLHTAVFTVARPESKNYGVHGPADLPVPLTSAAAASGPMGASGCDDG